MSVRKHIVNLAEGLCGVPYIWAGDRPATGFDCSGLVLWIFQALELLPKGDTTAQGIYDTMLGAGYINPILPDRDYSPKPGDLAFYGHPKISHVAICINDKEAISASGGGSKTVVPTPGAEVKKHSIGYRRDFVAIGDISLWMANHWS